jgi:hypothetical protein
MDPMTQAQVKEWFLMLVAWGFLGSCIYVVAAAIRRRQQNEMQKHMLEKFSSAQDFAAFVQSPAGQKYVMSFTDAVTSPRNSILNTIRTGIVLIALGAGAATGSLGPQANYFLHTAANILIFVGLGFLVSALISYFLAKKIRNGEKES